MWLWVGEYGGSYSPPEINTLLTIIVVGYGKVAFSSAEHMWVGDGRARVGGEERGGEEGGGGEGGVWWRGGGGGRLHDCGISVLCSCAAGCSLGRGRHVLTTRI